MIITTRTDLHTYLADTRADLAERYVDAVLDQIQFSDHPAWGADWSDWLAENVPGLVTATVDGDQLTSNYTWTIAETVPASVIDAVETGWANGGSTVERI
ncbi:MAG: hypothetical protein WC563_15205 [Brevundimonas sp.]